VEKQMLGLTHGELVQSILRHLCLPDSILQPIAAFHAAADHGGVPSSPAARLLFIADAFSTGLMLNSSEQTGVRPLHRIECRAATGREDPPPINCAVFRAEVLALTAECARLNPREQDELAPPPPTRRTAKIWLARDPSFSSFDPVATALEPMVELSVHNRLPAQAELNAHTGLIVLVRNENVRSLTPKEVEQCLSRSDPAKHPVLYLCGKQTPTSELPSITFANWPVSLSRLAELVAEICPKA
jgi:hypothetical protein